MAEIVKLADIRLDGNTQPRVRLDQDAVVRYAEVYESAKKTGNPHGFPPVVAFRDGNGVLWMADGRHRYGGAKASGYEEIEVDIREGTERDALLYALGCNNEHGVRMKPEDRFNAVRLALDIRQGGHPLSDRKIADLCKVSHTFVGNVRNSTGSGHQSEKRVGKDGRATRAAKKPEREPGDDTDAEKAEGKKAKANGVELCDWKDIEASFGRVARIPDQIKRSFPKEKDSTEYQGAIRLLGELAILFKAWKKKIAKENK